MTTLTRDQLEYKVAQAYQIIGSLLEDQFETAEGQRLLDYFGRDEFDPDFLPWGRVAAQMRGKVRYQRESSYRRANHLGITGVC